MGYSIDTKEPDWRNVSKKQIKAERPCVGELLSLMECMKRLPSSEVDAGCSRERIALQACAQKSGAGVSAKAARGALYNNLIKLSKSWKRFGFK
jgi:hypothetical protein